MNMIQGEKTCSCMSICNCLAQKFRDLRWICKIGIKICAQENVGRDMYRDSNFKLHLKMLADHSQRKDKKKKEKENISRRLRKKIVPQTDECNLSDRLYRGKVEV